MAYIAYNTPASMKKEEQLLLDAIETIKNNFKKRVEIEVERIKEEKKKQLAAREWIYSIKEIEGDWSILHRIAKEPIEGRKDNESWSRPFKIINNVLFHADFYYKQISHTSANQRIPQGLIEGEIDYKGW